MDNLETAVKEELESNVKSGNIKTHCAWCEARIPGTEEWYMKHGNACESCDLRFGKVVRGIRGKRWNAKKKRYTSYKIADYTEDEIKEMIIARKKEVIDKKLNL